MKIMIAFTDTDGGTVYIARDAIIRVKQARGAHHPNARTILDLSAGTQAVQDEIDEVLRWIERP